MLDSLKRDEYILAKGQCKCGETRWETGVRDLNEETGFPCYLLHCNMSTPAPPTVDEDQISNETHF